MKPGLRLRGFLLDEPMYGHEIACLMDGTPTDPCTLEPAQLNYTAAPSFVGLEDPIGQRVVLHLADRERVPLAATPHSSTTAGSQPVQTAFRPVAPRGSL